MEMIGGSSASYLARTLCVPLFCTLFIKGGNRRAFRLPGEGGDHFHCTVEPSPGHIRCRSNTELSEFFFGPHRLPGRELSELLSAYYLCAKTNSPSFFSQSSPSLVQNSVSSLFRNSTVETVFSPFPRVTLRIFNAYGNTCLVHLIAIISA